MHTKWEDMVDKTCHPGLWMWRPGFKTRLTHLQSRTLNHCPFSSRSPWLCTANIETHNRKTHAIEWLRPRCMPLGFKGWQNTQRKNLWSNLAKGGKAPTTWQGLMSESIDPITCPSIAANPPAGLLGCNSDGRQLCRAASAFLFPPFMDAPCECPTTEGQKQFSWDFLDTSRPTD